MREEESSALRARAVAAEAQVNELQRQLRQKASRLKQLSSQSQSASTSKSAASPSKPEVPELSQGERLAPRALLGAEPRAERAQALQSEVWRCALSLLAAP